MKKLTALICFAVLLGFSSASFATSSGRLKIDRVDTRGEALHVRTATSFSTCEYPNWAIAKPEWLSSDVMNRILSISLSALASGKDALILYSDCVDGKAMITGVSVFK